MKFPSIIQYIDSLEAGPDFFGTLSGVELCVGSDGHQIFASGNSGVVFKATVDGRTRALKCFTRPCFGRDEAYRTTSDYIPRGEYIIDYRFLEEEITVFVATDYALRFPILDMEWVEGETLLDSIMAACITSDKVRLTRLSELFDRMALWLLDAPMAHGDLKPENIIVTPQGALRLVDYDGIYLPQMQGSPQRESGTPGYQHPLRSRMAFSKAIDHYSIAIISLTLRTLALAPELYEIYSSRCKSGLLFDPMELIEGRGDIFEYIDSSNMASSDLWQMVQSSDPQIEGLGEALSTLPPAELFDTHTLTPFERSGAWGFCRSGGSSINPIYERIQPFSDGLAAVKLAGKWSYIDMSGCAIAPFKFDDAWSFSCGLGLVRKGDKYGFIGRDGRMAIAARYGFARNFSENMAVVTLNGMYGLIDLKGRWVLKPTYTYAQSVHGGVVQVEKDGCEILIEVIKTK